MKKPILILLALLFCPRIGASQQISWNTQIKNFPPPCPAPLVVQAVGVTLTCGPATALNLQTNGTNNGSQAALNFVNPASFQGLTFVFSNVGANETFTVSGILNASAIGALPGNTGQLLFNNGGVIGAEDPVVSQPTPSLLNATVFQATGSNLHVVCDSGCAGGGTVAVTQSTSPWIDSVTTWGGGTLGAMANYGTSPGAVLVPGVNAFITNTLAVNNTQQGTASQNIAQINGVALGSPSNYGTSPGAVSVPGVNAFITNTPTVTANAGSGQFNVTCTAANCPVNVSQWSGSALGAMANYGTSPGAVLVPGVNAFITNTPAVTLASTTITGTVAVTQSTSPWVDSVTTWGGGTLGAMANYGTSPGSVLVPGVNAFITNSPTVNQGTANATPWNENIAQVGGAAVTTSAAGEMKVGIVGSGGTGLDTAVGTANAQALTVQGNPAGVALPVSVQNLPATQKVLVTNTGLAPIPVSNNSPIVVYALVNGALVPVAVIQGQAPSAQSLPVVIASDQAPVAVKNTPTAPSLGLSPAGPVSLAVDQSGVVFTRTVGLPLQPCNAVRVSNCQHQ